ncbi:MAG: hydroxymethylbilane synthase [Desulfotomaculum sp. BICA1-6]|nr:MAG: hydroxymethylbilane synthase [Peptococcaceae bacterium BRH_c8a]KJS72006.1 MAG: hydroxymethylbilane synthase [Desulfotomaculum sp. BICA1-6]
MPKEIIIGSRDSDLAMWQSRWVAQALRRAHPKQAIRITGMKTKGDHILEVALAKIGDKGLFTKELEVALLSDTIDMAVHSMKDLPTGLPDGLVIGAVCQREQPGDVLISRDGANLDNLRQGARIGTSSLRRRAQLLHYRPDLQMVDIRGNLNTRLRKFKEQELDAIVLAYAGIKRLGFEDMISQYIPYEICLPAVGQGSLGIEVRANDGAIRELIAAVDHAPSRTAIQAERAFLKRLEGGCQVPIGALGRVEDGTLQLEGIVAGLDGTNAVRHAVTGPADDAAGLGNRLAEILLDQGAGDILRRARQEYGIND